MNPKHYLTTPIYYASGAPHLGHAYTTLIADCVKRFRLLTGDAVKLITGTDEHGQKIERAAQAAGMDTRQFVDARSREFECLWDALGIAVDQFERTSSASHAAFARAFWSRLADRGEIYTGEYHGRYCVECEQYFTDGEICPVHRRPLETFSEPSYFFRLSTYQARLEACIEQGELLIEPAARRNEVLSFLNGNALHDLSISRVSTRWGVPVPGDAAHVMYVWVDALVSYLSALSPGEFTGLDDVPLLDWWRNATHFIGKDILTFHAVYWPALLLAAGLPLPRKIIVNGWLTAFGRKIAKSDPETIIDPSDLTAVVGRDGLRWYFLKAVSLGQDVDFSHEVLVRTVNADLANNLGNLFSRFVALVQKLPAGTWRREGDPDGDAEALRQRIIARAGDVVAGFEAANPAAAARAFIEAAADVNAFFQQAAPWQIADEGHRRTLLWSVHQALTDLTVMGTPFVPETMAKARAALCLDARAAWDDIGRVRDTVQTRATAPIYARIG